MKQFGAILILISVASAALFGFILLAHNSLHASGCINLLSQGAPCPEFGVFTSAIFHVELLKKLSTATLIFAFISLLIIASALIVRLRTFGFFDKSARVVRAVTPWNSSPTQHYQLRLMRAFLARFENSPAIS